MAEKIGQTPPHLLVVKDATTPKGDMTRQGASHDEIFADALRKAMEGKGNVVNIKNIGNIANKGPVVTPW